MTPLEEVHARALARFPGMVVRTKADARGFWYEVDIVDARGPVHFGCCDAGDGETVSRLYQRILTHVPPGDAP